VNLVFFSDSPFRKYANNENLIPESPGTGTDAAHSGTLISVGEIYLIACVVSYMNHIFKNVFRKSLHQGGHCKFSNVGRKVSFQCIHFRVL
jgi:hypothetical protein